MPLPRAPLRRVTMPRRPRRLGTPIAQVAVSVVMVTGMGTSAWET